MMFEIYTKEVEIVDKSGNKQVYKLRPLSGRFLPKLYSAMSKFQGIKEGEEFDVSVLDEDTVQKLHTICLETFKASYPDQDVKVLDEFVSQNLLKLLEPVIQVNVGEEASK